MRRRILPVAMTAAILAAATLTIASCGADSDSVESVPAAVDPALDGCTLCGMVVREQLAPRAQVVHRDGERAHLCAISELGPYLTAPSPHGRPVAIWVERLSPEDGPGASSVEPHPWITAETAFYVVDGPKRAVMGESILVYSTREEAAGVASAAGGTVLAWSDLRERLSR